MNKGRDEGTNERRSVGNTKKYEEREGGLEGKQGGLDGRKEEKEDGKKNRWFLE